MRGGLVAALLIAAVGCGDVVDDPDSSPAPIADAATSGADAAAADANSIPDASSNPDARPVIDCTSTAECPGGRYCDFLFNGCGPSPKGACRAITDVCPADGDLVCACNGTLYSDECTAANAGHDVAEPGTCTTPDGFFRCGYKYCLTALSYCEVTPSGVPGPSTYECKSLPSDCANCSCLTDEPCGASCSTTTEGGFVLTCPAPP